MNNLNSPQAQSTSNSEVIAIRIEYANGKNDTPVYILMSQLNWRNQLREAMEHFKETVEESGKGSVTVHTADSLSAPPIGNPSAIEAWEDYRMRLQIGTDIPNPRIEEACNNLTKMGVDATTVEELREDTRFHNNRASFRENVEKRISESRDRDSITTAFYMATRAHKTQTYAKEKYPNSLAFTDVPYVNHSIQVANMATELGLSTSAIQAALLHDVVEDTEISLDELSQTFSPDTIALVGDLTRRPDESRANFTERISCLQGEAKILKCLDRLHNLLRGYCLQDAAYLERCIDETERVYSNSFLQIPQLKPLLPKFTRLLEGLKSLQKKIV